MTIKLIKFVKTGKFKDSKANWVSSMLPTTTPRDGTNLKEENFTLKLLHDSVALRLYTAKLNATFYCTYLV